MYRTHGKDEFSYLSPLLDNPTRLVDEVTGEVGCLNGYKRNMRVREYLWGLAIEGSLNKWLHDGSNLYELTLHDAGQAIEDISEELHTDLSQANITGLEVGTNIILNNSVQRYFKMLGEMPRRVRDPLSRTSLYYNRKGSRNLDQFVFYDKIAQAKKEKISIPTSLDGLNLMRAEIRFNGCLRKQLGRSSITGKDLLEKSFYGDLRNRLIDRYYSIEKLQTINIENMDIIKRPTDAAKLFFSLLFSKSEDGQQSIEDYIQQLKDKGVFTRRGDYNRTRDQITDIINSAVIAAEDPLKLELDRAFERLRQAE